MKSFDRCLDGDYSNSTVLHFSPACGMTMPSYTKYDPRVDSLVVETVTNWDPSIQGLSVEDRAVVEEEIHRHPQLASKIEYERAHTGFTRTITVTEEDIARLYEQNTAAE